MEVLRPKISCVRYRQAMQQSCKDESKTLRQGCWVRSLMHTANILTANTDKVCTPVGYSLIYFYFMCSFHWQINAFVNSHLQFLQYRLLLQHVTGFSVHWFLLHRYLIRLAETLPAKPTGTSAAHSVTITSAATCSVTKHNGNNKHKQC